jgi:hypothetical protein
MFLSDPILGEVFGKITGRQTEMAIGRTENGLGTDRKCRQGKIAIRIDRNGGPPAVGAEVPML